MLLKCGVIIRVGLQVKTELGCSLLLQVNFTLQTL